MRAIETTATIDEHHRLVPDHEVPVGTSARVRLIILLPEEDEIGEQEWLGAAASNPAFDFLKDAEEDIYTPADGVPFHVQG